MSYDVWSRLKWWNIITGLYWKLLPLNAGLQWIILALLGDEYSFRLSPMYTRTLKRFFLLPENSITIVWYTYIRKQSCLQVHLEAIEAQDDASPDVSPSKAPRRADANDARASLLWAGYPKDAAAEVGHNHFLIRFLGDDYPLWPSTLNANIGCSLGCPVIYYIQT